MIATAYRFLYCHGNSNCLGISISSVYVEAVAETSTTAVTTVSYLDDHTTKASGRNRTDQSQGVSLVMRVMPSARSASAATTAAAFALLLTAHSVHSRTQCSDPSNLVCGSTCYDSSAVNTSGQHYVCQWSTVDQQFELISPVTCGVTTTQTYLPFASSAATQQAINNYPQLQPQNHDGYGNFWFKNVANGLYLKVGDNVWPGYGALALDWNPNKSNPPLTDASMFSGRYSVGDTMEFQWSSYHSFDPRQSVRMYQECEDGSDRFDFPNNGMILGGLGAKITVTQDMIRQCVAHNVMVFQWQNNDVLVSSSYFSFRQSPGPVLSTVVSCTNDTTDAVPCTKPIQVYLPFATASQTNAALSSAAVQFTSSATYHSIWYPDIQHNIRMIVGLLGNLNIWLKPPNNDFPYITARSNSMLPYRVNDIMYFELQGWNGYDPRMPVSLRQQCEDGSDQTYLSTPGMTLGSLGGSWVVTQDMVRSCPFVNIIHFDYLGGKDIVGAVLTYAQTITYQALTVPCSSLQCLEDIVTQLPWPLQTTAERALYTAPLSAVSKVVYTSAFIPMSHSTYVAADTKNILWAVLIFPITTYPVLTDASMRTAAYKTGDTMHMEWQSWNNFDPRIAVSIRQQCADNSFQFFVVDELTLGSLGASWVVTSDMLRHCDSGIVNVMHFDFLGGKDVFSSVFSYQQDLATSTAMVAC